MTLIKIVTHTRTHTHPYWLKQQKYIVKDFRNPEVGGQDLAGFVPSRGWQENYPMPLSQPSSPFLT